MNFFIVDDDPAVRGMLADIIEDEDLGNVVGQEDDGSKISAECLGLRKVDILLIDMFMPKRDGLETIRDLSPHFKGRSIMISQMESKDIITEAYQLGIDYYITKPINRLEVNSIIYKVCERVHLEKSIETIQRSLHGISYSKTRQAKKAPFSEQSIQTPGSYLLTELGMIGEIGSKDILDLLQNLYLQEKESASSDYSFPSLKDMLINLAKKRRGSQSTSTELRKEIKATEQRIRRAIFQALIHLASIGLTDYSNPKFESYSCTFFDFHEVRKVMMQLDKQVELADIPVRINMKKFIYVLYAESKRLLA
jgi:two-component system response regulator YcbB